MDNGQHLLFNGLEQFLQSDKDKMKGNDKGWNGIDLAFIHDIK